MSDSSRPQSLGEALSHLIQAKGIAKPNATAELSTAWRETAGERIASHSRVINVHRGILNVAVSSSALMGELSAYHRDPILEALNDKYEHLKIKGLKFRLRGDLRDDS
ncbi:DUF721 domain-containing protein [Stratiformator vulcanicus]|nr:DUF721 domain-containing protein [Stratiformator vulcanicus]